MRKKGLILLVVIFAIIAVLAYFTRDRRIENLIENIGESIVGAKVEIDHFHFSLFKMECSWDRLQIADKSDPWKNIFETGTTSFNLEARPLIWRRIIIREMILENVRSGSKRETDGSLPKKPSEKKAESGILVKAKKSIGKQLDDVPVFDLSGLGKKLNIDSLVDVNNLLTVQGYEKLYQTADSSFLYWKSELKTRTYLDRAAQLEKKIKQLKLEEIKDVPGLTSALTKVNNIQKDMKSLRTEVQEKHSGFSNTFARLQKDLTAVQNNLKKDINRAKQLARLKDLDVKDVSLLLFGAPVVSKTEQVLGYVALGRKYLPIVQKLKGKEKEKKPPRLKGQDIHFPFHYAYPKFLLKHARLSAATSSGDTSQAYFVEGELNGLTNQPAVFGKPTRFLINAKKIAGNQYEIKGSLDHIGEIARDSLWITARNFGLGQVKLKKGKYFPSSMTAKNGDISLAGFFIGDGIDLKIDFNAAPVDFIFDSPGQDKISRIVRDVLQGLTQLKLTTKLKGEKDNYKLSMNSNVDNVLANQVKQTIAKNLRQAQQQIEDFVNTEADKRRKQVESLINKNKQTIYAELDKAKATIQKKYDELEKKKKEVEKKIEDEKKKLEQQAKDKLKGLFKKP